jgi:hypothetical protein
MAAQNKFAGKEYSGTFKGGETPGHTVPTNMEGETKGLLNPATSGRHLSQVSGSEPAQPKGGDGLFDLHAKPYVGPENWTPENKGDVSNQPSGK